MLPHPPSCAVATFQEEWQELQHNLDDDDSYGRLRTSDLFDEGPASSPKFKKGDA